MQFEGRPFGEVVEVGAMVAADDGLTSVGTLGFEPFEPGAIRGGLHNNLE